MLDLLSKLGIMGVPLLLCSFLLFTIAIEKIVFFINTFLKKKNTIKALENKLLEYKKEKKIIRDEAMSLILEKKRASFSRRINLISFISNLSPMLGLVGTVLGIIKSFQKISQYAGSVSPSLLADSLWEAMLTTVFGLLIAIFAISFAHLFRYLAEYHLRYFCEKLNYLSLNLELEASKQ